VQKLYKEKFEKYPKLISIIVFVKIFEMKILNIFGVGYFIAYQIL